MHYEIAANQNLHYETPEGNLDSKRASWGRCYEAKIETMLRQADFFSADGKPALAKLCLDRAAKVKKDWARTDWKMGGDLLIREAKRG